MTRQATTPTRPRSSPIARTQPAAPRHRVPQSSAATRASGAVERPPGRGWFRWLGLAMLPLVAVTALGSDYYLASAAERMRSPLHAWLRPSGYVGQTAGVAALAIFLTLWLYPLRRRFRRLAFTGSMARWLDVHVALALVLPLLAAVHAGWQFHGLIGLGFFAMLAVWFSGIAGRYLYVRVPRTRAGLEMSAGDLTKVRHQLLAEIAKRARMPVERVEAILGEDPWPCEGLGIGATLAQLVRDDVARWRATRALARECTRRVDRRTLRRIRKLARREMALMQRARLLGATQRMLRLWHVVHRPFAIAALAAVVVHIAVAVAVGATWFR